MTIIATPTGYHILCPDGELIVGYGDGRPFVTREEAEAMVELIEKMCQERMVALN